MGSEITYRKLKDCAVWYSGGTPRKSNAEYWNGTIPWISAKSLHDTFICDSEDKVTELGAQNGTRTVPEGTILFVVRGMSLKNEFRVGLTTDTVTFNQDLKALLPVEGIDSHYLLYFLKSKAKDILSLVEEAGHGTGVLPTAVLQELDVPVPPLQQQKLVAKVILNFDEKIKINRQINQTLEQMAQTLFKSWFVDFDPVIDNALDVGNPIPEVFETRVERRKAVRESADFKPLPDDVRQLFPSEFEESELGWVPKGWGYKKAKESATISIGKTPPRKQTEWFSDSASGENVTWVSIRDMGNFGAYTQASSEYLVPEAMSKFNVKRVPKGSVLLSFKLTLGRVSIARKELATNEAIAHFVSPKFSISSEYLYCYLSTFDYGSLGSTSSIATAVNSKIIKDMPVLVPSEAVLEKFCHVVAPYFERLKVTDDETLALEQLRNVLLPKLISGELRLDSPEVEKAKALVE